MDTNNQNNNSAVQQSGKSYWKHVLAFFLVLIVIGGGYWTWDQYFSESAKYGRQVEENMNKYIEWEKNYNKAMTEDTYGGKTPQETLNMFVEALKKEDIDLASKYFALNDVGKLDQKWVDGLKKTKEAGKLQEIVISVPKMEIDKDSSDNDTVWFIKKRSDGIVEYSIIFQLNKYSGVWKIESL